MKIPLSYRPRFCFNLFKITIYGGIIVDFVAKRGFIYNPKSYINLLSRIGLEQKNPKIKQINYTVNI